MNIFYNLQDVYNLYIYFVFVFPSLCILNFNAILEHELNRFFITAAVQFTSQFRDTLHVCFLSAAVAVEDLFLAELITLNVFYSSSFSCRFITTTVISYPLAKFYTFFYHHHEWSFTTPCVFLGPYMEAKDIKTRKEGWRKWDEHTHTSHLQIWIFEANVVWSCKKKLGKIKLKNLFKEERKNCSVFLLHLQPALHFTSVHHHHRQYTIMTILDN